MNKFFRLGLPAAALCSFLSIATAAPDGSENRKVDARIVRVRLDGLVDLRIRQGAAPALVLSGDAGVVARATTEQRGDTLHIDTESEGHGRHRRVHAELTLPALREVTSESVGTTEIRGFSGDEIALSLDGAGSMQMWCNYKRVTATLGGVGHMNLAGLDSESVDLNLNGAGYVKLSGRSKWLKADLGGLGGLDARGFSTDSVNLDMSGLGNATVSASQNATLSLSGLGSVTVYGKPLNRKVTVDGLGKVSWK
ncbi:MAG TPA: DUF2807 domain-containing protein [Telluria sp.]